MTAEVRARRRLVLVLGLGLAAQLVLILVAHVPRLRPLHGDESRYSAEALRIAAGAHPEPDFLWPPLYGFLLGKFYALVGVRRLGVELAQGALFLVSGRLVRATGLSALAADAATALYLIDPQIASFAQYLWPEVPHLFCALLGLVLLFGGKGPPGRGRVLAAGAVLGVALLLKSLLGPFVPVLAVAVALAARASSGWQRCATPLVFLCGIALLVAPVIVFNGLKYGTFSLGNSGPFNVWVGLNDPASRTDYDSVVSPEYQAYAGSKASPSEKNRMLLDRIAEKVRREGVFPILGAQLRKQYVRLFDRESFFSDQLPGGRWEREEGPDLRSFLLRAWAYGAYAVTLILSVFGVFQVRLRSPWDLRAFTLPGLFVGYNLALFLFVHVKTRYRLPILVSLLFFAALVLERLVLEKLPPEGSPVERRLRVVGGALVSVLVLMLAFLSR